MVARISGVMLWAAPRFRRRDWELYEIRPQDTASNITPGPAHPVAAENLHLSKMIADAASENPEGAA